MIRKSSQCETNQPLLFLKFVSPLEIQDQKQIFTGRAKVKTVPMPRHGKKRLARLQRLFVGITLKRKKTGPFSLKT